VDGSNVSLSASHSSAGNTSDREALPWRGGDVALILLTGVVLVILSIVVVIWFVAATDMMVSVEALVLAELLIYGGLALVAWYVTFRRRHATREQVGFSWVGIGPLLLMFLVLVGFWVVNLVVGILSTLLLGEVPSAREQLFWIGGSPSLRVLILLFVAVVIVAPVVEEFVFRGVLFQYLRSRRSFWVAASISALLFSISHFVPSLIPSFFAMGLILAALVERYRSLYPAIALHALNNAFATAVVFSTWN
jgi:membrane protease YdiL (CAAX protease family)